VPLLPLEPFCFPENLLVGANPYQAQEAEGRWWVLHTRPRSEKALARKFMAGSVPFFLPLYHKRWRSGGQRFSSYLPLFPGYVFLFGDRDHRLSALETNLVANVLPVSDFDQDQVFDDLGRVYGLMTSGSTLTPEARLKAGIKVEITGGPFTGMEGTILRQGSNLRFVVEVRFLHQGVSVELESWMIQPELSSPRMASAS
jgi:transcription antitermination factor NusG